jgi:hypothetical protein
MNNSTGNKTVLLTFDYEVFLGKISGTPQKCMIEPTAKLIDIFKKRQMKGAIFFADVTYLCKLKLYAGTNKTILKDFNAISAQIIELINEGHYVFPHIHPHWLDAKYHDSTNIWDLSNVTKYRFNSLTQNQKQSVFDDGINLLKEIILPHFPDYIIDSYRAGGLSIQPFEDFKPFFLKHGIINDFSVLPEMYEIGSANSRYFDFRNASHLNYYKFNTNIEKIDYRGNFNEFVISKVHMNFFEKLLNRIILKINTIIFSDYTPGDGIGTQFDESVDKSDANTEVVSLEWSNSYKIHKYLTQLNKTNYLHFISHPKMLSKKNILILDYFLSKIKDKNINYNFRNLIFKKPTIVVCSYITPPEPGIGGRRWAKFSKYLKKHGFNISILSAELSNSKIISPWINDVENIEINRLPRKYPAILDQVPNNLFSKFKFLFTRLFFDIKLKGTIYDKSSNWEKQFNKFFKEKIVKDNIYAVITTGAPFKLMYLTANLKKQFPHLKVINDFRDPWTWGEIYGFKSIKKSRLQFENYKESQTIQLSDYITSSAEFIYEVLEQKYPNYQSKFRLIPHGFDKDDFFEKPKEIKKNDKKIKILYGGTLYENLTNQLKFIIKLAETYPDNIEIDFYTNDHQYEQLFSIQSHTNIKIFNQVNAKDFFKLISHYNYYLCITNDRIKDNISTKYYEIFANNTPILYLGPNGYISEMITKNDVGISVVNEIEVNELYSSLEKNLHKNWGFKNIGLEKYDFENLSLEFEQLILSAN